MRIIYILILRDTHIDSVQILSLHTNVLRVNICIYQCVCVCVGRGCVF